MAGSTLNPPEESKQGLGIGHTTDALGPSDSSDSGSDIQGAARRPGDVEDELDAHALEAGALEFGSDTDSSGTGERAAADGDGTTVLDADIVPDSIENIADIAADSAIEGDPSLSLDDDDELDDSDDSEI